MPTWYSKTDIGKAGAPRVGDPVAGRCRFVPPAMGNRHYTSEFFGRLVVHDGGSLLWVDKHGDGEMLRRADEVRRTISKHLADMFVEVQAYLRKLEPIVELAGSDVELLDEHDSGRTSGEICLLGGRYFLGLREDDGELVIDDGVDASDPDVGLFNAWEPAGRERVVTPLDAALLIADAQRQLTRDAIADEV